MTNGTDSVTSYVYSKRRPRKAATSATLEPTAAGGGGRIRSRWLRQGTRHSVPRRTAPARHGAVVTISPEPWGVPCGMMGAVTALRVRVLGGFEVEGIATPRLGSRKARTLLKVLVLARSKPVTAELLADCLWPDGLPTRPADQLAVLVSRLRSALGSDALVRSDAGYALTVAWLDLDAMALLVDESRRRLAAGNTTSAAMAASAAVTLARGPLLPEDDDASWAETDRAVAARVAAAARRVSAEAALASSDLVGAALLAQGALDADPFDEPALRTLMRALAMSGRPASALASYAEMRARLAEELGVDPTGETEALHGAILMGEALP
jgi:DNA-binding SARP family transcriptional activator